MHDVTFLERPTISMKKIVLERIVVLGFSFNNIPGWLECNACTLHRPFHGGLDLPSNDAINLSLILRKPHCDQTAGLQALSR